MFEFSENKNQDYKYHFTHQLGPMGFLAECKQFSSGQETLVERKALITSIGDPIDFLRWTWRLIHCPSPLDRLMNRFNGRMDISIY